MSNIRRKKIFTIFLERFCDFGLSILTEYHSFLSNRTTSATGHRIGVVVNTNHRTGEHDYSKHGIPFLSSQDVSSDLFTNRQEAIGSNRSNSIQRSESKIPVDRNSRAV